MKKNTLRSLGIGFLSAGILSGAFAIFVQGQSPVEGLQVNSLLGSGDQEQISQYEEQVSSLVAERDSLNESLSSGDNQDESSAQEQISSLTEANESLVAQLDNTGTETNNDESDTETTDNGTDTDTEADNTGSETGEVTEAQPDLEGSFSIASGEASSEIAARLESDGFIDSADEFQSLLDEWDLNAVIQAGDFELNSDMSIHDIASIITDGAYYYY